ncbi:MAG TPA: hypothetical protein VME20_00285 [Acidimicrobiales bacterium]|nr:hypothetical protein [Acidimicrobiales bacterium]
MARSSSRNGSEEDGHEHDGGEDDGRYGSGAVGQAQRGGLPRQVRIMRKVVWSALLGWVAVVLVVVLVVALT